MPMAGSRVFDEGRKLQGFTSQEHLDAFYAYYDHQKACEVCNKPGPAHWSEADASWQPTMAKPCDDGMKLRNTWDSFSQYAWLGE